MQTAALEHPIVALAVRLTCKVGTTIPEDDGTLGTCYDLEHLSINGPCTQTECLHSLGGVSWEPGRPKLTPTDGTTVYVVPIASWAQALAGSHHATLVLPRGHWFEWPLGWFADSATKAEASWDHMTCELAIDDTDGAAMQWLDVDLSGASRWRTEDVKLKLPDATLAGVVAGPVIYLPPLRGPRTVTVTFSLDGDRPGARGVAESRTIVVVDVVPEDQVPPQGGRPPVRLGTP